MGLNGHKGLTFYCGQNSLLGHDVSGQSVYCNPPWSIDIHCVEQIRVCHSRSPLETRAVVVLPDWPKCKAVTKELKLIKQLPKGEIVFMRTSPTCTYDPLYLFPSTSPINFWLIDANTPVLSPLLTTNVSHLKPNIAKAKLEPKLAIETTDENLSTSNVLIIIYPYEVEALMRFTASLSCNELSSKADTLIDTAVSLNFVNKNCVMTNGFYKDCKTIPKLSILVASEQRISTTNMFCPTVFTINGHEFTDLQFRVLPHFKGSDIILRLPARKKLEVVTPQSEYFYNGRLHNLV